LSVATVLITAAAQRQVLSLPAAIQVRVAAIVDRLAKWPAVSGAKPLRHGLKGSFRIRTGSYRVVFEITGDVVTVTNVDDRRDVYR
jgi:mRNA-degrading endonuclease RelE of RelBE toxin-antitoxin system